MRCDRPVRPATQPQACLPHRQATGAAPRRSDGCFGREPARPTSSPLPHAETHHAPCSGAIAAASTSNSRPASATTSDPRSSTGRNAVRRGRAASFVLACHLSRHGMPATSARPTEKGRPRAALSVDSTVAPGAWGQRSEVRYSTQRMSCLSGPPFNVGQAGLESRFGATARVLPNHLWISEWPSTNEKPPAPLW